MYVPFVGGFEGYIYIFSLLLAVGAIIVVLMLLWVMPYSCNMGFNGLHSWLCNCLSHLLTVLNDFHILVSDAWLLRLSR